MSIPKITNSSLLSTVTSSFSSRGNITNGDGTPRTVRKKISPEERQRTLKLESVVRVARNPFQNTPVLTCYEVVKRILVGITLFPVRCIIFVFVVTTLWLIARLSTVGFPLVPDRGCYMHKAPLPMWRYILATPVTICFRVFLWCMGFWHISVVDHRKDRSVNPNIIVIGPHVTMFDMFVMMYVYPRSGFLGQHHTVNIPILNSLGTVTQGIFIDISDKDSKHSCKEGIALRASSEWKGGKLLIFPEGTITNGRQLVQFKAGAFIPGLPVQPVFLRYPWKHYDISWVGKNR